MCFPLGADNDLGVPAFESDQPEVLVVVHVDGDDPLLRGPMSDVSLPSEHDCFYPQYISGRENGADVATI